MRLMRPARLPPVISIVPLIDVLMILLVFFIVTSTFRDLDMLPLVDEGGTDATAPAAPGGRTLMLRIVPGGDAVAEGRRLPAEAIAGFLAARRAAVPALQLLLLPSPEADVQALAGAFDAAARAGVATVRVVRFEAAP